MKPNGFLRTNIQHQTPQILCRSLPLHPIAPQHCKNKLPFKNTSKPIGVSLFPSFFLTTCNSNTSCISVAIRGGKQVNWAGICDHPEKYFINPPTRVGINSQGEKVEYNVELFQLEAMSQEKVDIWYTHMVQSLAGKIANPFQFVGGAYKHLPLQKLKSKSISKSNKLSIKPSTKKPAKQTPTNNQSDVDSDSTSDSVVSGDINADSQDPLSPLSETKSFSFSGIPDDNPLGDSDDKNAHMVCPWFLLVLLTIISLLIPSDRCLLVLQT